MKKITKMLPRTGMTLLMVFGLLSQANAQDDQAYKEAYNAGLEAYKAKNLTEAYNQWEQAASLARTAGDSEIADKAMYYVCQLDYKNGLTSMKNQAYDEALQHFEKGIGHYPTFAKNFLGKGLALKKLNREEDAMATFVQTMEVATTNNDRETAGKAEEAIRDHYHFLASTALSRNGENATRADANEALGHLEKLQEFVELNADTYYYMAAAQNVLGDYAQAVQLADQALEMHRGSRTSAAKIWFVKGEALMYSGDSSGAKAAFQNATFGNYKNLAEHYIETLGS